MAAARGELESGRHKRPWNLRDAVLSVVTLAELRHGSQPSITAYDLGGQPRLRAAAAVGDGPWLVVVDISQTSLVAPIEFEAERRIVAAVGAGTVGLGILMWLWWRLARWVAKMEGAATRWAAGEWQHRSGSCGPDEFSRLSMAFDRMAAERQVADAALLETKEQLRETASILRAVLRAATEFAIMGVNLRGRVLFFNEGAQRILGYRANEVIGRSPLLFHDADEVAARAAELGVHPLRVFVEAVSHGQAETREWTFIREDGSRLTGSLTMSAMHADDGELIGFAGIATDITERKAVDRMKDEFISIVSHDLRTPLTALRASLGLLAGGVLGPLPRQGQRMLDIALSNADRLIRLVNDLLDLERLQSSRSPLERIECELNELVEQAVEVMRPAAAEAGVGLAVETVRVQVRANPDRLTQVVTNLLSNAIKVSERGTHVVVRETVDEAQHQARIEVCDQGRGVPADHLERIFEPFRQVDSSDARTKGGTGLGLAICRMIVEQHHGRIWVESTPGAGSTFIVALPLAAAS